MVEGFQYAEIWLINFATIKYTLILDYARGYNGWTAAALQTKTHRVYNDLLNNYIHVQ